eukprot:275762_1
MGCNCSEPTSFEKKLLKQHSKRTVLDKHNQDGINNNPSDENQTISIKQHQSGGGDTGDIIKNDPNNECNDNNYKQCMSTTRLLEALQYYSTLNITENHRDEEMFRKFMNNIYYEVINDYIHFNNHHTHELEHINNDLINNNDKCHISTCTFTSR